MAQGRGDSISRYRCVQVVLDQGKQTGCYCRYLLQLTMSLWGVPGMHTLRRTLVENVYYLALLLGDHILVFM